MRSSHTTTTEKPVQQQRPRTAPQKPEMQETSVAKSHTYKNTPQPFIEKSVKFKMA